MQLYNIGVENHPDGSGNLNAIVNGNWTKLNNMINPAHGRTASQSTTTLTASADTFFSFDVGATIRFADGTVDTVAAYVSPTQLTMTTSQTVTSQAFEIYRTDQSQRDAQLRGLYKVAKMDSSTHADRFPYYDHTLNKFTASQLYVSGSNLVVGTGNLTVLSGNLGVKIAPSYPLHVEFTTTSTGTITACFSKVLTGHAASSATAVIYDYLSVIDLNHASPYSLSSTAGFNALTGQIRLTNTGSTTNVACVTALYENNAAGTVVTLDYFKCAFSKTSASAITTLRCFYAPTQAHTGTVTNRWGVYIEDQQMKNYFAKSVGIGVSPSYDFHVETSGNATTAYTQSLEKLTVVNSSTSSSAIYTVKQIHFTIGIADTSSLSNTASGQTVLKVSADASTTTHTVSRLNVIQARYDQLYANTVTDLRLIEAQFSSSAAGVITTFSQLYLADVSFGSTTVTNKYAIYQVDTELTNKLEGITLLNLPSGEIYMENASLAAGITTIDTPVEITSGFTSRNLFQCSMASSHAIAVTLAGKYLVQWNCSFYGAGATDLIEGSVIINSATGTRYLHAHRNTSTAGYVGSMGAQGIITLTAGQEVSMCFQNHTDGDDITISDIHLTVTRIQN